MKVEWRTGIGYGDFVTGLGYGRNLSHRTGEDIDFIFHWKDEKNFIYKKDDSETLFDRFQYINTILEPTSVRYNHRFQSSPSYRFFNQFEEFNYLHGLSRARLVPEYKKIAVLWTSLKNKEFPGSHKDPVFKDWDKIIQIVEESGYEIIEVDYTTPVKDVIEYIRICDFGIGYDGLAHQLFKFMWKPLIVFCERFSLNNLLIPWATLVNSFSNFKSKGLEACIKESEKNMNRISVEYDRYLITPFDHLSHPLYNRYT